MAKYLDKRLMRRTELWTINSNKKTWYDKLQKNTIGGADGNMGNLTDEDKQILFATIAAVNCEQGIISEQEGKIACQLFSFWLEKIKEPNAVNVARIIYSHNLKGEYLC